MVCQNCALTATAAAGVGAAINAAYADKYPFLQNHPYLLPVTMGTIAFAVSSITMIYTGNNIFQYVYTMFGAQHSDSNQHTHCHGNEEQAHPSYSYIPLDSYFDTQITSSTICTEGTINGEKFRLTQPINHVFGRGGLDVFVLGDGEDHLYFSMCSTRIIDGHVATIYGFNPAQDKIYLFCTKKQLELSDVTTRYNHKENVTSIEIAGKFEQTAIAVVGDYPDLLDNVDFNVKYADAVATGICTEGLIEA